MNRLSRERQILALISLLWLIPSVRAQRDAKVPDPDPELERKALRVADGFEINLFAADPLLAKPIQMNFDSQGRLWVACSEVYPQIKPGQKANDKIIVLEDPKGSGKADKVTVFADGLLIPTGIEPGDGGAYVADSTDLLHFSDPGPDGKARKRRVVLSGFGTEDTHHILHTFRWGPDGMLYFNQSVYIHSHIETPYGVRRLNAGGIWQFRPESMRLEVYCRGFWNTWGHHFDRWGQSFVTDGANGEGVNYIVPGASYPAAYHAARILHGLNPGSPKHCGCEILSGRHLPPEWRGNVLTNDFRGHRVCRFVLREDGSGYASQEMPEVVKTSHPAFRPVDVKMGPDGAIYIADWYNPIIQHGEVDFRDPRRDLTHGRIWRVTAKGRPLVTKPALAGASTAALLDALKAPEDWTRHHAKRLLKERGAKILPELAAWIAKLDPKDADHEHHLLEALWTYQALDTVEPKLLATLLKARDHHARAAATRIVGYWHSRLSNPVDLLAERVADEHPQVRLEAVRSLAQIPTARSAEIALRAIDHPMDQFLDYALWLTARELSPHWLPALEKAEVDFGGNSRRLVFALQAVGSSAAVKPLVELFKSGKVAKDREVEILALLATFGGPPQLALVFDRVGAQPPARQIPLLAALEQSARQRGIRPNGDMNRVGALLNAEDETVRTAAARLVGLWKVESLRARLVELAQAAKTTAGIRQAAIDGLVSFGDKKALTELSAGERPLPLRRRALIGWATLDPQAAAPRAVELLTIKEIGDPTDLFTAFVQQKKGSDILARALANQKLPADVAKVGIRTVRASGRDSPPLVAALTRAGSLSAIKRDLSVAQIKQLVEEVQKQGDAARGEAIFRRKDQACLKCHAIAGAGGQVGPDLTSIGASAPVDYLVESILLPNKIIKEGFHSLVVSTKAGKVFTGIKVRETQTELVLRDAEDREVMVPIKDIDERANGTSLMPEGLSDPLTRTELVDLIRFLSELGKVGPYQVGTARVVRRWQALEPTREGGNFLRNKNIAATGRDDPALTWGPAYSVTAGTLPLEDLPQMRIWGDNPPMSVVRCQLDVTTAGKVRLRLHSATGLTVGLDGVPVEAKEHMEFDLSAGLHTLTIAVDRDKRKEGLRCELEDVPGSPARVRIVGGK